MAGELILIVDDTPVNLKLVGLWLANEGYQTLTAGSAEDALEILGRQHPALVLADLKMPGMDGLEMTRRIKGAADNADIGVIALTASDSRADLQRTLEAGCDGYLTKPIARPALMARIREFLEGRAGGGSRTVAAVPAPIPAAQMRALRRRFLDEGVEGVREFMAKLEGGFPTDEAARSMHQWIGTGGMLGYAAISRLAAEAEAVLAARPADNARLRELLGELAAEFEDSAGE